MGVIKHVIIALLEHFSRWIKLYTHVLLISSIEWILQFANISLALHLKCQLNRRLIALLCYSQFVHLHLRKIIPQMRTIKIGTVAFKQKYFYFYRTWWKCPHQDMCPKYDRFQLSNDVEVIIIIVLPPGVVCLSNRALPMFGTADGDAVSRWQVLGRAGSVHHGTDQ